MVSNITSVLIPFYRQTRAVVGLPDGGLANPMPMLFDPTLGQKPVNSTRGNFSYPLLSNVSRPSNDVDLAYMTVGVLPLVAHADVSAAVEHVFKHNSSCVTMIMAINVANYA